MGYFNDKHFSLWQVVALLTTVFVSIGLVAYAKVSVPNTFTAGTTVSASQMNDNFSALATAMPAVKSVTAKSFFVSMPATTSSGVMTDIITLAVNAPAEGNMYLTSTVYSSLVDRPCTGVDSIVYGPKFQILESSHSNFNNTSVGASSETSGTFTFHTVYPVTAGPHRYTLSGSYSGCVGDGLDVKSARLTGIFIPNTM